MQPHRGTLILVLGILSILICAPLGFFAWIMGNRDLKAMSEGRMDPAGRDLTVGGKICGMIGSILLILGIVAMLFFILVGGGLAILGGGERTESPSLPPELIPAPQQVVPIVIPR